MTVLFNGEGEVVYDSEDYEGRRKNVLRQIAKIAVGVTPAVTQAPQMNAALMAAPVITIDSMPEELRG